MYMQIMTRFIRVIRMFVDMLLQPVRTRLCTMQFPSQFMHPLVMLSMRNSHHIVAKDRSFKLLQTMLSQIGHTVKILHRAMVHGIEVLVVLGVHGMGEIGVLGCILPG